MDDKIKMQAVPVDLRPSHYRTKHPATYQEAYAEKPQFLQVDFVSPLDLEWLSNSGLSNLVKAARMVA